MPPPFTPAQDQWLRNAFRLFIAGVVLLGVTGFAWKQWDFDPEQGLPVDQPVPFSHRHHVTDMGISCRYCHSDVDTSAFAGMPDTQTCMSCHSQLWTEAEVLQPVRDSFRSGKPIEWQRVHDLADFVYFDHSVHLAHGIDCRSCHGDVADMPQVWREERFSMEWCLDCHRDDGASQGLQPRGGGDLFEGAAVPHAEASERGHPLSRMENCSVCHR
ncbi:cytochrome c3 family protein [Pelagicoccus sp. SDUM812005]|uniref:cytochrome c3 family protein n=1 Tax=Pelagicoccus sp. SDUM812005 TaxID=3041257 RepID=UPI00280FD411|nr:cytochrome c3 family protein [Pelagicoccus sp. SDUM812005]MDQ8181069.1 cytochrome c3 family protein [Pelagicoccus sp. SDUM812005]